MFIFAVWVLMMVCWFPHQNEVVWPVLTGSVDSVWVGVSLAVIIDEMAKDQVFAIQKAVAASEIAYYIVCETQYAR